MEDDIACNKPRITTWQVAYVWITVQLFFLSSMYKHIHLCMQTTIQTKTHTHTCDRMNVHTHIYTLLQIFFLTSMIHCLLTVLAFKLMLHSSSAILDWMIGFNALFWWEPLIYPKWPSCIMHFLMNVRLSWQQITIKFGSFLGWRKWAIFISELEPLWYRTLAPQYSLYSTSKTTASIAILHLITITNLPITNSSFTFTHFHPATRLFRYTCLGRIIEKK